MITPKDISEKKFEKSAFGYKTDEVDDFLNEILDSYSKLYAEKTEAEEKLEVLAEKLEEYRANEDSLRTVLIGAQKLGDNIIRDAKAKAEVVITEADTKVRQIYAESESQIIKEKETLSVLQSRTADFKKQLLAMYKQHLELISLMPENEERREENESSYANASGIETVSEEVQDETASVKADDYQDDDDINAEETKKIDLQF